RKRLLQIRALRRKQLSSVLGDVHVVFQSDTKFPADVDTRLVAETHIGRQRKSVAADKIGPLVAVHADSVSNTMSKAFVVGTIASVCDYLSRRCIYGLALHSGLGCSQRG